MIELNGNQYKLCLLDTNALSLMLKEPKCYLKNFILRFMVKNWIPAFSLFSIFEIRQWDGLFDKFVEHFSMIPSVILKGHEQLHSEELQRYPDPSSVEPVLLALSAITPPGGMDRRTAIYTLFTESIFQEREEYWKSGKQEVLEGILNLVKNFPSRNGKYTKTMIKKFVETNILQQLTFRSPDRVQKMIRENKLIQAKSFPSISSMALTVFFKFYPDQRRPQLSDIFDIIISAPLPYVDGFITEKHQIKVIRKSSPFLSRLADLELYTVDAMR